MYFLRIIWLYSSLVSQRHVVLEKKSPRVGTTKSLDFVYYLGYALWSLVTKVTDQHRIQRLKKLQEVVN